MPLNENLQGKKVKIKNEKGEKTMQTLKTEHIPFADKAVIETLIKLGLIFKGEDGDFHVVEKKNQ